MQSRNFETRQLDDLLEKDPKDETLYIRLDMQNDVCKKKFMIFPNILKIISLQTFEHKQFFYSFFFYFFFIAIMGNVTTLEHSSLQKQMINKKLNNPKHLHQTK